MGGTLRRVVRTAVVALTALAVAVSFAPGADAKKKKGVKTTVLIETISNSSVDGSVSSKRSECVDGRSVSVRVNDENAGSATTDEDGVWSVDTGTISDGDEIVAKVGATKSGSVRCGGDKDRVDVDDGGGGDDPPPPPPADTCSLTHSVPSLVRPTICAVMRRLGIK